MLIYDRDPAYTLFEVPDVRAASPPAEVAPHVRPLRTVLTWVEDYLCRPHPQLGRTGNVCPYARTALDRGSLYLTVTPGVPDEAQVRDRLRVYRDWFLELTTQAGRSRTFHTIVMVFPDLPRPVAARIIDRIQAALKTEYVSHGLMIGEFHDGPPDKPGLWNPEFRPLHGPLPMLAIRHMVPSDLLFLESDDEHLRVYLDLFADQVPPHLRDRIAAQQDGPRS